MTTEAGGHTLDGQPFAGGPDNPVEGEGGRVYVLTLVGGTWSAAFQPMQVTIPLGASGETATLTTTEVGGYAMAGAEFATGGTATSSGGANYVLTMGADGTWSAAFAPARQTVTLGASGRAVELLTNEAGSWTLGESALAGDGSDTYIAADLTYRLILGTAGTWMALFEPITQSVSLGTSGDTVTLASTEAGGWALGASAVADGYIATADNDNRYRLTTGADGTWTAAFVPDSVAVKLGSSGDSLTLLTTEAGSFTLDGTAVGAGSRVTSPVGESYVLDLGADSMWSATHLPSQQTVRLGASGMTLELMTGENGSWMWGDSAISTGSTVTGDTNAVTGTANEYRLTLRDGTWTATYVPATLNIKGTALTASVREDGGGYAVGEMSLPSSGSGNLAGAGGALYRVARDADGMLAGTRYDQPIVGSVMHENAKGTHDAPSLSSDDRKTDANELGTKLNALGASLSMADLLDDGATVVNGPNMVAEAHQEMAKIRDRVAGLVGLRRDDGITSTAFDVQVRRQWEAADTLVNRLFGTDGATLERTTSESRVVDALDRLVEALGSEDGFAAATLADGPRQLQGFETRTDAEAVQAFNRVEWTASGVLGTLGSTRFGAAAYNSTGDVTADFEDAERAQAFAWSTVEATRRASDVLTQGSAYYTGSTFAGDQAGNLYEGSIDVQVRFASSRVDGLVSDLARTDTGVAWSYGFGGEVSGITLPRAALDRRGAWRVRSRDAEGRLSYEARAGSSEDLPFSGGEFSGRLLGRGDAAGAEALGTWKVEIGSSVLAGGFGARRGQSPAQRAAAAQARDRFRTALSEAGLADDSTVDPADSEAVSAVVNQFQEALQASGYSAAAVATAVASYRAAVLSSALGQVAFQVALATFSAAQTTGTLMSATTDPATEGFGTVGTSVVLAKNRTSLAVVNTTRSNFVPDLPVTEIDSDEGELVVGAHSYTLRNQYIQGETPGFKVDLATLFGDGFPVTSTDSNANDALHELNSKTFAEMARTEIQRLYNQLKAVIALDSADASASARRFANGQRQRLFNAIQLQIADQLFAQRLSNGTSRSATNGYDGILTQAAALLGTDERSAWDGYATWDDSGTERVSAAFDYPVNSEGVAQDRVVLADIEAVLAALGDETAFAAAFESGGIFAPESNRLDGSNGGGPITPRFMFNKDRARILLVTGTTDYTRFGTWRKQSGEFAAQNQPDWRREYSGYRNHTNHPEPFAYSPLAQTRFSAGSREYPGNVLATYTGSTVAVTHTIFLTGEVVARVRWNPDLTFDASATPGVERTGRLSVSVNNLTSTDGAFGPLRHGLQEYRDPVTRGATVGRPGTYIVRSLVFEADIIADASGNGAISFQSAPNHKVRVVYDNPTGTVKTGVDTDGNFLPDHLGDSSTTPTTTPDFVSWRFTHLPFTEDSYRDHARATNVAAHSKTAFDAFNEFYGSGGDGEGYLNVVPVLDATITGKFVGQGTDGPPGMIGIWSILGTNGYYPPNQNDIPTNHFLGVGNARYPIHGAFGADLGTSPP